MHSQSGIIVAAVTSTSRRRLFLPELQLQFRLLTFHRGKWASRIWLCLFFKDHSVLKVQYSPFFVSPAAVPILPPSLPPPLSLSLSRSFSFSLPPSSCVVLFSRFPRCLFLSINVARTSALRLQELSTETLVLTQTYLTVSGRVRASQF